MNNCGCKFWAAPIIQISKKSDKFSDTGKMPLGWDLCRLSVRGLLCFMGTNGEHLQTGAATVDWNIIFTVITLIYSDFFSHQSVYDPLRTYPPLCDVTWRMCLWNPGVRCVTSTFLVQDSKFYMILITLIGIRYTCILLLYLAWLRLHAALPLLTEQIKHM